MRLRLLCGLSILLWVNLAMAIEEPKYSVLEKFDHIELRAYAPMVVAETMVDGDLDDASRAGFKRIADYIFGNNTAQTGRSEKISMTAPVAMAPNSENIKSEKISMTAPVGMQAMAESAELDNKNQWRMYFVMPSRYSLETLPKPNNSQVTLRALPASRMAVLRFSGLAGEAKVAKKTAELLAWLKNKQITPIGEPELARYNPPWTLPFLRRNEVMVAY